MQIDTHLLCQLDDDSLLDCLTINTVTVMGRMSKACSRADMLFMIAAEDGEALIDSGELFNRVQDVTRDCSC